MRCDLSELLDESSTSNTGPVVELWYDNSPSFQNSVIRGVPGGSSLEHRQWPMSTAAEQMISYRSGLAAQQIRLKVGIANPIPTVLVTPNPISSGP